MKNSYLCSSKTYLISNGTMKIGDKVRFLNEVGGGTITGFQGKDVVIVEDADGFDVPMNVRDCVVVNDTPATDAEPQPAHKKPSGTEKEKSQENRIAPQDDEPPITFKAAPYERRGGDVLNVYLCFVPNEIQALSKTNFDTYLVNDSNYFLDFTYLHAEGRGWHMRHIGTAEPNTKLFLENIERENLNDLQRVCIQLLAYKTQKPFTLKAPLSIELRPDLTKFYKLHTFTQGDFFDERVLTLDVVRNDSVKREVFVDAEQLREELMTSKVAQDNEPRRKLHAVAIKREQKDDIDVTDLHAAQLLDTTSGMSSGDILEYQLNVFRKKMDAYKNKKGKKLIFIHGKGEGVLRGAMLRELQRLYPNCTAQDASFREYGFGATMVIIH